MPTPFSGARAHAHYRTAIDRSLGSSGKFLYRKPNACELEVESTLRSYRFTRQRAALLAKYLIGPLH
jgi:hypothetical protein